MSIDASLDRVRNGQGTGADFQALESWLAGERIGGDLYDVISNYLWHAAQPKFELVTPFLALRSDPMVVAAVVSGLATRGYGAPEFVDAVVTFASGEPWDEGNDLRIAALLALPRVAATDSRARSVLSKAAADASPSVRDCAVTAAQQLLGTPSADILWGKGEGNLIDRATPEVKAWLGR